MKRISFIFILLLGMFTVEVSRAQDWANLERFKKDNSALHMPKEDEKRIVFMGNSITEGWPQHRPEFFTDSTYVNRGISGQTTPQMLLRFRQDVIQLKPAAVVILAGINDIAENTGPIPIDAIADNIISMSELAKANNIKVILCSVLPAFDFPWRPGLAPADKVIQLNSMLKLYAEKQQHVYVDYFSAMVNDEKGLKKDLGYDGIHPNKDGYLVMEPLIKAGISTALETQ